MTASVRVVVPASWRVVSGPSGSLRVQLGTRSCRYTTTYTATAVAAPDGDVAARVAGALPAASSRHLLDDGRHGTRAWRVVRHPTADRRTRVEAVWSTVLTRRSDVAPPGQVVWADVRTVAASRPGDECHAGTWREALGPSVGDSLAVARARPRFTRR